MVEAVEIRSCTAAELPALVALLDEEFIRSKGRRISLAQRFPAVLHADNCSNILVLRREAQLAASIACKHFDWITPARRFKAAMLGLVYTQAASRRLGLASRLLQAARLQLTAAGVDFAVLFTVQPEFYARLGWISADNGVFGTYASNGGKSSAGNGISPSAIEALRPHHPSGFAPRNPEAYRSLPLPAERLEMRACKDGSAYAIYGLREDCAYVYEFGGAVTGYDLLWQDVCAAARNIYINECADSPAMRWLEHLPGITWRKQSQAMWLPITATREECDFTRWYVPYLDRL